ncbi:hypothetical protein [Kutzneria sp. NPDC052558]|uniref:hypothetical protein n=1 Tax=Kutzneria sp. NPDC052558 TaxID=3364121 RepID=UPI0037C9CA42
MTGRNGLFGLLSMLVVGAVVGAMVVSCGIRPSTVIHGQGAPRGTVNSLIVYLIDHGTLRAVNRPLPSTATPTLPKDGTGTYYFRPYPYAQDSLDALLAGPTGTEAAGGLTSELPSGMVASMSSDAEASVFRVFVKTSDARGLSEHAVDQIVCTVAAAFTSTDFQSSTGIQVQVLDELNPKRQPRRCPLTP